MSLLLLLPDDTLRVIVGMFIGDEGPDMKTTDLQSIARFGATCKTALAIARDRAFWEPYYASMFPASKMPPPGTPMAHVGPCTYRRCMVGHFPHRPDEPYTLSPHAFIMEPRYRWWNTPVDEHLAPSTTRCRNAEHYAPGTFVSRNPKSRYKDLFRRAATRRRSILRLENHPDKLARAVNKAKWAGNRHRYQRLSLGRQVLALDAEHDRRIQIGNRGVKGLLSRLRRTQVRCRMHHRAEMRSAEWLAAVVERGRAVDNQMNRTFLWLQEKRPSSTMA